MKHVNFGIIGIGTISHRFVLGLKSCEHATLVAVASRSAEKAKVYAEQYQIPYYYDSYLSMVTSSSIDMVYIATPPALHYEHMMLCLQHGKHVLCEKPLTSTLEEATKIFAYAKRHGLFVMEAQKAVFLPTTIKAKEWLDQGKIGELKYAEASYCYHGEFAEDHFIYDAEHGGGSLFDVGVYPLSFLDFVIDKPVISYQGVSMREQHLVDSLSQVLLTYEPNVLVSVRSGIGVDTKNIAYLYGTQGHIEIEQFWKSKICRLYHNQKVVDTFHIEYDGEFQFELRHAVDCVLANRLESPIMSHDRSLRLLEILSSLTKK